MATDDPRVLRVPAPEMATGCLWFSYRMVANLAMLALFLTGTFTVIAGHFAGALALGAAFILYFVRDYSPPLTLRRQGSVVLGLPGEKRVPVEDGRLVVLGTHMIRHVRRNKRNVEIKVPIWKLLHTSARTKKTTTLVEEGHDPVAMRTLAEAVARLARTELWWQPEKSEAIDKRTVEQLDQPLALRLRNDPSRIRRAPPVEPLGYRIEPADDETMVFFKRDLTQAGAALVGLGVLAYLTVFSFFKGRLETITFGIVLAPMYIGALGFLLRKAVLSDRLKITRAGVSREVTLLDRPLVRRHLSSDRIESLYIEHRPRLSVVAAGDGLFKRLSPAALTIGDAKLLVNVIEETLSGRKALPPAEDAGGGQSDSLDDVSVSLAVGEHLCPRCQELTLVRRGGELDESVCASCGGILLPDRGTERLVEEELGVDRDMIRQMQNYFTGERLSCPLCRSHMSPMRIKGEHIDLCTGCGATWLDAGELSSVSRGRYPEEARLADD
jgi:Zn-finger nucleic acid-binding protein